MTRWTIAALAGVVGMVAGVASSRADEGMWLLTNPPKEHLKATYGFEPTAAWLEQMQKSAVRFSTGGSGSIVSADGLVMTNHHVASEVIQKVSTAQNNYMRDGFLARTRAEEIPCPDLELTVLWSIEDVTARVKDAAKGAATPAEADAARRKMIATITKESQESTGLQSEVVTLYQGGQYHLYRSKRYTDVRLVFAPEESVAFFGGDTDNFEYPRWNLDVTFFRVYENGQPLRPEHHLRWSAAGASEGDLALIFGHPGRTRRLNTVDHLRHIRDVDMPARLASLWRSEIKLQTFAGRSAENARLAREDLFGVANGRKASTWALEGLHDPRLMAAKQASETELRSRVAQNPQWQAQWGDAWDNIAKAKRAHAEIDRRYGALQWRWRGGSRLADFAVHIVRLASELPKPNAERLREYAEANLDSVYLELYSPAPLDPALEAERLSIGLGYAAEMLGGDDPVVRALLGRSGASPGLAPRARAAELVARTRLADPAVRKALVEGGAAALAEAVKTDPLLAAVAAIEPETRALRTRLEDEVEAVERESYAKIAAARFAVEGDRVYPDATFTLRMGFGPVKGYADGGASVPAFTRLGGIFTRFEERRGQDGFELPQRWLDARGKLNPETPFNFVANIDIIGGNSGSPVVDTKGEVVGLIFDMNLQGLTADFAFNAEDGRAIAVDSRGIVEALRVVYQADELIRELTAR